MDNKYSVLMSVYYAENANFFEASINSMLNQSICTDDFVIVCDGPLTNELNSIIDRITRRYPGLFNVVRLKYNQGLGNALNIGLKECRNELVARMDSDDISLQDRCERQLNIFNENLNVDIISGTVIEFDGNVSNIIGKRVVPEFDEEIRKYVRFRCPFNHPCVMYKKTSVEQSGGYQDFYRLEDYYLWVRMLMHGFVGYNIQQPLLLMRSGDGLYKRRGGLRYAVSQFHLAKYIYSIGLVGFFDFLKSIFLRCGGAVCPNVIKKMIYRKFLR